VRVRVKLLELLRARRLASPFDLGAQHYTRDGDSFFFVALHRAHGLGFILVYYQTIAGSEREKGQHVTARDGGNERSLRVDELWISQVLRRR